MFLRVRFCSCFENRYFGTIFGSKHVHRELTLTCFNRVIFHEVMETVNKVFIRDVTKIEKTWLIEYAPEFYKIGS